MPNLSDEKILKYIWYYFLILIPFLLYNIFLALRKFGLFSERLYQSIHPISVAILIIGIIFLIMDIIIVVISLKRNLSKYLILYPSFNVLFYILDVLLFITIFNIFGIDKSLNILDYLMEYTFIVYIVGILLVVITVWKIYPNNVKNLIKEILYLK